MSGFVGIDGGGTRTRAALIDDAGIVLSRAEGAAGRVDVLNPGAGVAELAGLVRSVLRMGHQRAPAEGVCCALAGAGRAPERMAVEQALRDTGVARHVLIVGDFEAALQNAIGDGPGMLVIAGTGSSAWGRSERNTSARVGGWGHILGDEGSGYAIGNAGLRAAMHGYDGRLGRTALLDAMVRVTAVTEPEGLVRWAAAAAKGDVAALATSVLQLASSDPTASAIADRAARDLAIHVAALHARLAPWTETATVAFTGGLIAPGGLLRPYLRSALEEWALDLTILERDVDAALGAATLAKAAFQA